MDKRLTMMMTAVLLLVSGVEAALSLESSHYQGRSYFNGYSENGVTSGHVDFAVYDTQGESGAQFEQLDLAAPGGGQYIYAYQIFNDSGSDDPLEYFNILGIGEGAIADAVGDIGSVMGDDLAVGPTSEYFNASLDSAVWEFDGGILAAGKNSFLLMISSDHDWTAGGYNFRQPDDSDISVPNPEPCTIALLGLGSMVLLKKRRKAA